MAAAQEGHLSVVLALLFVGAQVNSQDNVSVGILAYLHIAYNHNYRSLCPSVCIIANTLHWLTGRCYCSLLC